MQILILTALLAAAFTRQALATLATTISDDGNGKSIYVPTAGSTSSVAAPAATPTLIYNCDQMPLICENVAAWVKQGGGGGSSTGDLATDQLFYFDPEPGQKDTRRSAACGCFDHDSCVGSGKSGGKSSGSAVTDIATSTLGNAISSISPAASPIILAGANPKAGDTRTPVNAIPGRFFQQGVGLTCDEFPAATFIEGGTGAETICAMQSWQVYQGDPTKGKNNNAGKWPLPNGSGNRQEQDWQASVHVALRKVLGIGSTVKRTGYNTVYPFLFTTTTTAAAGSKAWVQTPNTMTIISKRDTPATTVELVPRMTNIVVTGDDEIDSRNPYLNHFQVRKAAPAMQGSPHEIEARATPRPHLHNRDFSPRAAAPIPSAAPASLFARGSNPNCDTDFDTQGLEDTEVGDAGFDDDLPEDESAPNCNGGTAAPQSDVQQINLDLDGIGDDGYNFDNCCGGGTGCSQIDTSGLASVALCGQSDACIGCAQLANYVDGLIGACTTNGNTQGNQTINQAPELTVVISINDSG